MKFSRIIVVLIIAYAGFSSVNVMAQDAQSLLKKMDNVIFSPKDKQGNVEIYLINSQGNEKVREAVMLQKGTDLKIYRYTKPESQAGIATLSLPDGVMWLYMPAFGKPKKISMLAKSQAFTGTDFSYEDMATTPYSERYTPSLLETNDQNYVLEIIPKDEDSKYSKIIVTLNKGNFYPEKMEYYDQANRKFKEATYEYEKIGNYWNARQVIMADLSKQHMTKIILKDVKFDQGIPDEEFTIEKLAPNNGTSE
ncbi:MAG: outer membrane lipoprotein-sorting protein [Bacteroidetes bacterium]|nr:outer membrane lipoprotein-sorting protein [Bacteroidota bacterium]